MPNIFLQSELGVISNGGGGDGAVLSSIQQVEVLIGNGQTEGTTTITAIDMDKTFLIFGGFSSLGVVSSGLYLVDLLNPTTVHAQRSGEILDRYVNCCVVEFSSGIESIQRGVTLTENAANTDIEINAVDLTKSFVSCLGWRQYGSAWEQTLARIFFVDSDTIRISRYWTNGYTIMSWEVVEFS